MINWRCGLGALATTLVLTLGACATSLAPPPPGREARFDWFEYSGNDATFALPATEAEYRNPILAGFYPDPSIVQANGYFYLVNSTFSYFPGIPVFRSRDLVNWTQIGNVIDRPDMLNFDGLGISRGVFAPTINYHEGVFYVLNTCVDCDGNFLVTATDPAGPWSDPVWLQGVNGIDPSIFFDDDGRAYIINNDAPATTPEYDGHRALWMQEYDIANQRMIGPRRMVLDKGVRPEERPIWIEGPHIFKHDGRYYLICAEGGTAEGHSQVVLRSDNVWGPWEPYAGNPIATQRDMDRGRADPVTSVGHADFVQLENGDWWTIFLAVRPYGPDQYNTGRETYLHPVTWNEEGWPVILPAGTEVPYVHARPALAPDRPGPVPHNGNFTFREEFDWSVLPNHWLAIRTPRDAFYDMAYNALVLKARPQHIGRLQQPSFLGRRQQHINASASTSMLYTPERAGDEAGLLAFQNDDYYYFLAVTIENGARVVQVQRRAGPSETADGTVIASAPLNVADGAPVYLKIDARGALYDFSYGTRQGEWNTLLEGADGTILSTRTAGGFVGVLFGLYAYTPD